MRELLSRLLRRPLLVGLALSAGLAGSAAAQEPMIATIKVVGENFEQRGWAECDGRLLAISSNSALFSLIGTIYGGDGVSTFALPDLRGRLAMHWGAGPGLTVRKIGEKVGSQTDTMTVANLPSHSHSLRGSENVINQASPSNHWLGEVPPPGAGYADPASPLNGNLNQGSIGNTGGGLSFNIQMPYLAMRYLIALYGIYPSRS